MSLSWPLNAACCSYFRRLSRPRSPRSDPPTPPQLVAITRTDARAHQHCGGICGTLAPAGVPYQAFNTQMLIINVPLWP
jgi:hypothetical protein